MIQILKFLCLILISVSCTANKSALDMEDEPKIEFGTKQTLTGIYTKSVLAKAGTAEHRGRYKLAVTDSLEVNLLPPYMSESIRPIEEVEKFEGKRVSITGLVIENTSLSEPSLDQQPLTVNTPSFLSILSIKLAE